jgi:hypothetical protein
MQDQLAPLLVLVGLWNANRVWGAKVESQIPSVFDVGLSVIATVLGVAADELLPAGRELKRDLPALQKGER